MTSRADDAHFFGRSGVSLASTIEALGDSVEVGTAWLAGARERRSQPWQHREQTTPSPVASTGCEERQTGQYRLKGL